MGSHADLPVLEAENAPPPPARHWSKSPLCMYGLLPTACLIGLVLVLNASPLGGPGLFGGPSGKELILVGGWRPKQLLEQQRHQMLQRHQAPDGNNDSSSGSADSGSSDYRSSSSGGGGGSGSGDGSSSGGGSSSSSGGSTSSDGVGSSGSDGSSTSSDGAAEEARAVDLRSCLKEKGKIKPFTVDDFMQAKPGRFQVEAVLNSAQPREPTAVTMFVIATVSRQDMLDALCVSYGSVISLAYYIPVLADDPHPRATVANDLDAIQQKFDTLEGSLACQLDVLVVSERVADATAARLFPINALRNLALLAARTELVMLGDLDMLIGADLRRVVHSPEEYRQLVEMTAGRRLVVVPTFQTWVLEWAEEAAEGGKAAALDKWDGEGFRYFLQGGFDPAHTDTDFPRWANATDSYELANTHELHAERRLRGNQTSCPLICYPQLQHLHILLNDMDVRYVVHPNAYMVHRPHEESAAKQQFDADVAKMKAAEAEAAAAAATAAGSESEGSHTAAAAVEDAASQERGGFSLFGTAQRWLDEQFAAPSPHAVLVTPAWRRCRETLSYWDIFGGTETGGMKFVTSLKQGSVMKHRRPGL